MKNILVISLRNSCRSQMVEGWLSYYGKGSCEVFSAGIVPTELDMHAANAMTEAVIDISRNKSKGLTQVLDREYKYIIVLAHDITHILPVFKGNPSVYEYPFPDIAALDLPENDKKKAYSDLRDELENFCFDFVHQKIKPLL